MVNIKQGQANYLKAGSYNMICDRCGRKYKRESIKPEWQKFQVCEMCWEAKHPWLEPLPMVHEMLPVPEARPRPQTVFVSTPSIQKWGGPYVNSQGIYSDLLWGNWDLPWGQDDKSGESFDSTNFPLV